MKTFRQISLLVLVLYLVRPSPAQTIDSTQRKSSIAQKMYNGAVQSLAWYDIPIATADLAQLLFVPSNATGKPIKFPPTDFGREFRPHVGVRGSRTFVGQVGEAGAAAFLGIRLLINIGSDLARGNVTSED